jgi:hypothetical protein
MESPPRRAFFFAAESGCHSVAIGKSFDLLSELSTASRWTLSTRCAYVVSVTVGLESHMETIVSEQRLATSGQVTPSTAAQLGRMLAVSYLIVARIDNFSATNQSRSNALSLLTNQAYYVTQLNLDDRVSVIEIRSGQIVGAFTDSEAATSGQNPVTSRSNGDAYIAEQAPKLVGASATAIIAKVTALKLAGGPPATAISGRILDISGDQIVISLKATDGVVVGAIVIFYDVRSVPNPDTGKTIDPGFAG